MISNEEICDVLRAFGEAEKAEPWKAVNVAEAVVIYDFVFRERSYKIEVKTNYVYSGGLFVRKEQATRIRSRTPLPYEQESPCERPYKMPIDAHDHLRSV
ncbi:MAG: hypothetical protein L0Y56_10250 [Nitrospira sp.]|nr:hypothetical protein [Nitrospira sp.]